MVRRFTPFLLLAAIALQGTFGALQGSVIICFGGGHEHAPTEVVEHCHLECSHHTEWPLPTAPDSDIDDCACTDVEVDLISMLATLTGAEYDVSIAPAISVNVLEVTTPHVPSLRPPRTWPDPGLIVVRSTRLQV
jgi:hypothetical protein